MRLIDADALIHELNNSHYPVAPYVDAGISIAIGKVCDAPTIEPERKKGHWEIYVVSMIDGEDCRCSECGKCGCAPYWEYCPNCGAKMEEGRQE